MAEGPKPDLTEDGKKPWLRRERRLRDCPISDARLTLMFTMVLSVFLLFITSIGAFLVLLDAKVSFKSGESLVSLGGYIYPDIIKGSVLTLVMIGGFTAVVSFWLRITNTEAKAQEANTAIAFGAAPAAAEATQKALDVVASLPPAPLGASATGQTGVDGSAQSMTAGTVNIDTDTTNLTQTPKGTTP